MFLNKIALSGTLSLQLSKSLSDLIELVDINYDKFNSASDVYNFISLTTDTSSSDDLISCLY